MAHPGVTDTLIDAPHPPSASVEPHQTPHCNGQISSRDATQLRLAAPGDHRTGRQGCARPSSATNRAAGRPGECCSAFYPRPLTARRNMLVRPSAAVRHGYLSDGSAADLRADFNRVSDRLRTGRSPASPNAECGMRCCGAAVSIELALSTMRTGQTVGV